MKKLYLGLFAFLSLALCQCALAATPLGKWKTIDDATNKARSIVRITENKGVLSGTILKVYPQPGDTGYCTKCKGSLKNKPVVGLRIMWGLKQKDTNKWGGGRILDPKIGKTYRCKITVSPDNKKLFVRGYIGISLLGRTQTWLRAK